jgi:hypothetical protein
LLTPGHGHDDTFVTTMLKLIEAEYPQFDAARALKMAKAADVYGHGSRKLIAAY